MLRNTGRCLPPIGVDDFLWIIWTLDIHKACRVVVQPSRALKHVSSVSTWTPRSSAFRCIWCVCGKYLPNDMVGFSAAFDLLVVNLQRK